VGSGSQWVQACFQWAHNYWHGLLLLLPHSPQHHTTHNRPASQPKATHPLPAQRDQLNPNTWLALAGPQLPGWPARRPPHSSPSERCSANQAP
jgi:hypothetical protein